MTAFAALGRSGSAADVDTLMHALSDQNDFTTSRLVDFALGLVEAGEGVVRLRYYLFHGVPIQRNYAALYFKRLGRMALLDEAVARGKIDPLQAYSR
jgi:hypothetical protein